MANPNTRRIFLTGSFAATIISGSLLGAYIKMNQEAKQKTQTYQASTTQDKIDALLVVRQGLVARKTTLESQIRDLEERMRQKEERARQGGDGTGNG